MYKCLKEKCPMFITELNVGVACKLVPNSLFRNCEGYDKIDSSIEETICKISELATLYDILAGLKGYIRDGQND